MKKLILLMIVFAFSAGIMLSQTIADYVYSTATDGSLVDMSTGTTPLLTVGTYYDDTASAVINLGFNFKLGANTYSQFSVNSNGQMQLGATAISGGSASPALNLARLAPLSGDNAIRATGKMHYKVTGSSPNQILVVEWVDLRVNYSSATETGTYCKMQALLYEGSNRIQYIYGTMYNMSTSAQSRSVYLSTSNIAGSIGQITTINVTPTWNVTATSLTTTSFPASSAMVNLDSAADGSRRVFTFDPPVATNAPVPATVIAPFDGGWSFTNGILSWAPGAGTFAWPTSYDVYFGTTSTPTFIQNQAGTTYTPTLAANTTYYWQIVPKNAIGDATGCPVWSFKTPSATQIAESFEVAVPPVGWANGTTGNWLRSTSYYKDGVACAYKSGSTTTQYVLSTPKATITTGSTLNFWAAGSSTTTASLQVVYSPDRVTWTQIGSDITYATTYTFYNQVIDLSSLAGNNYYLGFRTGTVGSGSSYVDMVFGPEITPEAPGPAVQALPADLAVNVNEYPTFTWTAPVTGGVPTGYKVYCDQNADPTTLLSTVTGLTYTATTPLTYGATYYWKVVATNAAGDAVGSTVRSFTVRANPVISTFPWTVDFGTLTTDWPVLNWSQLIGFYGSTLTAGTQWFQDDWLNVTTPANKSAKINIYGTTRNGWLITPPIQIPSDGYELKFDVALLDWNGTVPPVAGEQADDKFIVLMSDSPLMTAPTVLREWNNAGSPYVFDNIPSTGINTTIALTGISGTKYFAFYGESTVTGGDNDLMVDNVTVRETPAAPIFTLTPTEWDFGAKIINTTDTKQFTITNTGGGTLNLSTIGIAGDYYSLTVNPAPVALTAGQSANFTVQYAPTAVGTHTGTVTITDNRAVTTVNLSGSCYDPSISTFPFVESFDGDTFAPLGWTNVKTAGTSTPGIWDRQTAGTYPTCTPNSGAGMARYNMYNISSGGKAELTTPPLNLPGDNYRVAFYMYRDPAYPGYVEGLNVYYNTTNSATGGTLLGTIYRDSAMAPAVAAAGWYMYTFNLPAGSGGNSRYIVFEGFSAYGNNLFLDDVVVSEQPAGAPDAVTLTSPADASTGLSMNGFDLAWTPALTGGVPTYYAVYMSMDESTLYSDIYFETTETSLNPTTYAGGPSSPITFNYDDRYYWTVEAVNGTGSAVVEPPFSFQIRTAPTVISTFPWEETFEGGVFPPVDWTVTDVDGGGTNWVSSTTYNHTTDGTTSAKHAYSTAVADPGQNGWMVTPAIAVPEGLNMVLSFWNYNVYPTWMIYNGVLVNTTDDPTDPGWVELWSADTAASAWSNQTVNISAYGGQTVYFAFNYQGYDGDDWYVDDISISELTVDLIPPTITHLPHLNTPRDDIAYTIFAEVVDDATWNNPISGADLHYSTDATNFTTVPMVFNVDGYYATIPAQVLGTTVTYYITASDSEANLATSDTFSFGVNNPTWIWYDQGGTTYLGYTTVAFGPTVLFTNPFYGTGIPMLLNSTDGSSYYGNTANLHVYSFDGTTQTDLTGAIPVTFGVQTYETFDLSSYNLNINTQYFMIAYEDCPMGNYILFDGTYDYGTSYVNQGGVLYTMSNPGSWAIGAYVTNGTAALDAPVATITEVAGAPVISWAAITGANSYNVYGADDPYAADPWTLVQNLAGTEYTYTGTEGFKFFKVTSDTAAPARSVIAATKTFIRNAAREIRAQVAPKSVLKLRDRK
jgi:hypothetical protein